MRCVGRKQVDVGGSVLINLRSRRCARILSKHKKRWMGRAACSEELRSLASEGIREEKEHLLALDFIRSGSQLPRLLRGRIRLLLAGNRRHHPHLGRLLRLGRSRCTRCSKHRHWRPWRPKHRDRWPLRHCDKRRCPDSTCLSRIRGVYELLGPRRRRSPHFRSPGARVVCEKLTAVNFDSNATPAAADKALPGCGERRRTTCRHRHTPGGRDARGRRPSQSPPAAGLPKIVISC